MRWVALVGIGLELFGLGLAIQGLNASYRSVTKNTNTRLWLDVLSELWAWFKRLALRRRPPPVHGHIHAGVASATLQLSATAAGRAPPPADATVDERIDDLMRRTEDLRLEIRDAEERAYKQITEGDARVQSGLDALATRVDGISQELSTVSAVAGVAKGGEGLRQAAAGLVITFLGVGLSITGLWA